MTHHPSPPESTSAPLRQLQGATTHQQRVPGTLPRPLSNQNMERSPSGHITTHHGSGTPDHVLEDPLRGGVRRGAPGPPLHPPLLGAHLPYRLSLDDGPAGVGAQHRQVCYPLDGPRSVCWTSHLQAGLEFPARVLPPPMHHLGKGADPHLERQPTATGQAKSPGSKLRTSMLVETPWPARTLDETEAESCNNIPPLPAPNLPPVRHTQLTPSHACSSPFVPPHTPLHAPCFDLLGVP